MVTIQDINNWYEKTMDCTNMLLFKITLFIKDISEDEEKNQRILRNIEAHHTIDSDVDAQDVDEDYEDHVTLTDIYFENDEVKLCFRRNSLNTLEYEDYVNVISLSQLYMEELYDIINYLQEMTEEESTL